MNELIRLHADLDRVMIANSKVSRAAVDKPTKRDAKKGNNGNLGAGGICHRRHLTVTSIISVKIHVI